MLSRYASIAIENAGVVPANLARTGWTINAGIPGFHKVRLWDPTWSNLKTTLQVRGSDQYTTAIAIFDGAVEVNLEIARSGLRRCAGAWVLGERQQRVGHSEQYKAEAGAGA